MDSGHKKIDVDNRLLSDPEAKHDHYKKFSFDELKAISAGVRLAQDLGYFPDDALYNHVGVVVARLESQIVVKRLRGQNLSQEQLIIEVTNAIKALANRAKKRSKHEIPE